MGCPGCLAGFARHLGGEAQRHGGLLQGEIPALANEALLHALVRLAREALGALVVGLALGAPVAIVGLKEGFDVGYGDGNFVGKDVGIGVGCV